MTIIEAIVLGIIQGITEFLPISSSGHLKLAQAFLGMQNLQNYLLFDLICHLGSLGAIGIVFRKEIYDTLTIHHDRLKQIILAILPLFPMIPLFKWIKETYNQPQLLGGFFLLTAFLLYAGIKMGKVASTERLEKNRWRDAIIIGMFQALALFPGLSRSGATIAGAKLLRWPTSTAVTFSFLLAIPSIFGGVALEVTKAVLEPGTQIPLQLSLMHYFAGAMTSFLVGYAALVFLMKLAVKEKLMYFVWYCAAVGIVSLIVFNF